MPAELWFRNPRNYVRECVEAGATNFAWDRGLLRQFGIDPGQFANLWLRGQPWRALVIGDQGTDYIDFEQPNLNKSKARFATWEYGLHRPEQLREWCAENPEPRLPHMVVVTKVPGTRAIRGRNFAYEIAELQKDHPDCIIHVHGMWNFKFLFGVGFKSVDYEARTEAAHGILKLPNGRRRHYEEVDTEEQLWVDLIDGESDKSVPSNRCTFNISSALWASKNWETEINFRTTHEPPTIARSRTHADWLAGDLSSRGETHNLSAKREPGDMITCNTCSLQLSCKLYRKDEVCSVPNSEGGELVKYFGSRDWRVIQEGVAKVFQIQMDRAERGVAIEERRLKQMDEDPDHIPQMDPEVTKILDSAMKAGLQLVKINQPKSPKAVFNNINQVNGQPASALSVQATTADNVAALEAAGWTVEQITPEVLDRVAAGADIPPPPKAIPSAVEDAEVLAEEE